MSRFVVALAVAAFALPLSSQVALAGSWATLYEFHGSDGIWPTYKLMRDTAGNLYGTTFTGGATDDGTVYKLAPDGTETVLHSFQYPEVQRPLGGVVRDADGNLYGATQLGGVYRNDDCQYDCGSIYKLAPDGTLSLVHAFAGGADGGIPAGQLTLDSHGNLYGVTQRAGYELNGCNPTGCGTIYKIAPDGTLTVLHAFTAGTDGRTPRGGLVFDRHGNLYGTTSTTIFKIAPDGTLTTLHTLAGGAEGSGPNGDLAIDRSGNLYGTTVGGGTGNLGVVFKLAAADGSYSVMHSFTQSEGRDPSSVMVDKKGDLYGELEDGGPNLCKHYGCGTLFKIAADGTASIVHPFRLKKSGYHPAGGLVQDPHGWLYGVTRIGGYREMGTVFRVRK